MIIKIGYSGTRDGMTQDQMRAIYRYLTRVRLGHDQDQPLTVAHHGDCVGGDAEFHVIATVLGYWTIAHPPANPAKRAWCKANEIREPKGYLARDHDIATEAGELLAAPKTPDPVMRSGTWATIRYSVQLGRPVTVFLPNGSRRPASDFRELRLQEIDMEDRR